MCLFANYLSHFNLYRFDVEYEQLVMDFGKILHHSVSVGHLHCVNTILDVDSDAINRMYSENTPLMIAAQNGWSQIAEALIAKGADVCALNEREEDALMLAAAGEHHECVIVLIREGAAVDRYNRFHRSALVAATEAGNVPCMRLLLEHGAKFDLFGPHSSMVWVIFGLKMCELEPDVIEKVLLLIVANAGALNIRIFVDVVHKSNPQLVHNILNNPDIVIKGNHGQEHPSYMEALVRAIENGFAPNVDILLQHRHRLRLQLNDYFRDIDGKTVLQMACEQNVDNIVKLLLKYGADPNLMGKGDEARRTPMFIGLRSLSYNEYGLQFMTSLIKHGCELEKKCLVNLRGVQNKVEVTALEYALYGRNIKAAQLLVAAGARVYNTAYQENRPHKSLVHRNMECTQVDVKKLVESQLNRPLSLYASCRMAIRGIMGLHLDSAVRVLPLARHVQDFISYKALDEMADTFKQSMLDLEIRPQDDDMTEVSIDTDLSDSMDSDDHHDNFYWNISDVSSDSSDDDYLLPI